MIDARITTEEGLAKKPAGIRPLYKFVSFVYAHGKLQDDLGTDLIYLMLGDQKFCDGLIAYTDEWKPVRFHLYKNPRNFETTGVVTYSCEDKEAYDYGRQLVKNKPTRF